MEKLRKQAAEVKVVGGELRGLLQSSIEGTQSEPRYSVIMGEALWIIYGLIRG